MPCTYRVELSGELTKQKDLSFSRQQAVEHLYGFKDLCEPDCERYASEEEACL